MLCVIVCTCVCCVCDCVYLCVLCVCVCAWEERVSCMNVGDRVLSIYIYNVHDLSVPFVFACVHGDDVCLCSGRS